MKQQAIIYICLLFIGANLFTHIGQSIAAANESVVKIPDEAIRLRILANSDSQTDQKVKRMIRNEVNKEITKWVKELTSIEKARDIIEGRIDEIEVIVRKELKEQGIDQSFKVEFGKVQFPTKMYGNYLYPAGKYEAILITLGDGKGANWWCVLFPPLCFLDFSNGDAVASAGDGVKEPSKSEATDEKKVEVKFFVVEWITKLANKFS